MITNNEVTNYSLTEVLIALRNSTNDVTTALLDAVNKLIELFHSDEAYGLIPVLNSVQGVQLGKKMLQYEEFIKLAK